MDRPSLHPPVSRLGTLIPLIPLASILEKLPSHPSSHPAHQRLPSDLSPSSISSHLHIFNPILGVTNSKSSELLTLLAGAQHQVTPRQTTLLHSWWLASSSSTAFPRTPAAAHRVVVGSSRHSRHKDNPDSSIGRAIVLCPVQASSPHLQLLPPGLQRQSAEFQQWPGETLTWPRCTA